MQSLARIFIILGVVFLILGGLAYLTGKFNLPLGHLPSDIRIEARNFGFYFPLTTCLLISAVLTLFLTLVARFWRK
jgi:hypothetical protein